MWQICHLPVLFLLQPATYLISDSRAKEPRLNLNSIPPISASQARAVGMCHLRPFLLLGRACASIQALLPRFNPDTFCIPCAGGGKESDLVHTREDWYRHGSSGSQSPWEASQPTAPSHLPVLWLRTALLMTDKRDRVYRKHSRTVTQVCCCTVKKWWQV